VYHGPHDFPTPRAPRIPNVGGLAYRSTRRIFGLGPDSVLIGLFYIGGTMLLLAHS
jgi:hypothetical protein